MSRTFEASLSIGIGDLILMYAQFEGQKHHYDRIRLTPNWSLLAYRSEEFRPFVRAFFELLFQGPPYEHALDEDLPLYNVITLRDHGFPFQYPRLAHKLCAGGPMPADRPYIILNTKIRDLPIERWEQCKGDVLAALATLPPRHTLVLMGEREIEYNPEYAHFGKALVYSIYHDLKDNLPVTDLTIPRFWITPPNLDRLRRDCGMMQHAKRNIMISLGGSLCMALAVGKVLMLRGDCHPPLDIYTEGRYPEAQIIYDTNAFLRKVRELNHG